MSNTIRLSILISAAALFAAGCAPMPMDNQGGSTTATNNYGSSYNTSYNEPTASAPIPEAGPLSETQQQVATAPSTAAPPVPAANPNPIPVATVPQVPAATHTAHNTQHHQPAATNTSHSSPYGAYAANNTASTSNTNSHDYSNGAAGNTGYNDSYTSYGTGNTGGQATNNTHNYAANTSSSTNNYYSGGSNNYASAGGSSAGGSAAVQVFASVSQAKADRIRQEISSQGLNAVVDQVDGLYKVRVPFPDEGAARANLMKVRHASGTPGAFVTVR